MAGLFDRRDGEDCYCVLTTAANDSMKPVHNRMPLVVPKRQISAWLTNKDSALSMLAAQPPDFVCISAEAQLRLW